MGDLSFYLGVHYEWSVLPDGRLSVQLSQEGHIYKMLENHNMTHCNAVETPFRSGLPVNSVPHDGLVPEDKAFDGFGHHATVIIALVLIVSRGLSNSGAIEERVAGNRYCDRSTNRQQHRLYQ